MTVDMTVGRCHALIRRVPALRDSLWNRRCAYRETDSRVEDADSFESFNQQERNLRRLCRSLELRSMASTAKKRPRGHTESASTPPPPTAIATAPRRRSTATAVLSCRATVYIATTPHRNCNCRATVCAHAIAIAPRRNCSAVQCSPPQLQMPCHCVRPRHLPKHYRTC